MIVAPCAWKTFALMPVNRQIPCPCRVDIYFTRIVSFLSCRLFCTCSYGFRLWLFVHLIALIFASSCVATAGVVPWLTERQSKCPLCKFDVAEYLRQYHQEHATDGESSLSEASSSWNPMTWVRYRSWTAVAGAEDDQHHNSSSNAGRPSVYDDEERQTVVIELAENSVTIH